MDTASIIQALSYLAQNEGRWRQITLVPVLQYLPVEVARTRLQYLLDRGLVMVGEVLELKSQENRFMFTTLQITPGGKAFLKNYRDNYK